MRAIAHLGAGALLSAAAALTYGCATIAGIEPPDTSPAKQHCVDGKRDDGETDIDCGGPDCLTCGGDPCTADAECQSGSCAVTKCVEPTCSDGVFDGYESSLDCGDPRGAAVDCTLCSLGDHCFNHCNCASSFCDPSTSLCADGTPSCNNCTDGVTDHNETDVDCGGLTACPRCGDGKKCVSDADCVTGHACGATTHVCGP
jgi:hypothetical protein